MLLDDTQPILMDLSTGFSIHSFTPPKSPTPSSLPIKYDLPRQIAVIVCLVGVQSVRHPHFHVIREFLTHALLGARAVEPRAFAV